jgi:hypothetical protein
VLTFCCLLECNTRDAADWCWPRAVQTDVVLDIQSVKHRQARRRAVLGDGKIRGEMPDTVVFVFGGQGCFRQPRSNKLAPPLPT